MSSYTLWLLSPNRRARVRQLAAATGASVVAAWIVDAAVDAGFLGGVFVQELFHPSAPELWMRAVVATLLVLLFVRTQDRARLQLLTAALAEAPDGVQVVDVQGRVCYSNAAVQALYGYGPEELRGRHVDLMNADPHFAERIILPALQRAGRWAGELDVRHKDGHVFPVWLATALVPGGLGRPPAAIGIIRDISERKRTEEELRGYAHRLEDANQLKELFADILRHDLLGPVSTVRLALDLLDKEEHAPRSQQLVARARRGCAQLTEMIDSAALYAKVSAAREIALEQLDLGAVLAEVVAQSEPFAEARRGRIAYQGRGAGYLTRAHPLIADVFANLISNAVKYGPDQGTVAVGVEDAGDRWHVSVADRGEGVPDADKPRLFNRFERLGKAGVKGTGLGLAIAKRIVEMHGGGIAVEDNPGGGAVFRVSLPKG
ncbi:PAS domain-containing sensor histidine kinase [Anaeromyxobacter diazotrophicus]|uniref:histidine kinase n=1 Tax=Anaeromyxobacter diazotrophicus TaxID=2590199 RepID=A0A7I9VHW1_9BACT|nr:PAS domain-containing sensor histidine kinase [Anaeromyxobacter diazotrophicus]GEJ55981.1 hypothetical protein AMYX_07220 [Anaeromyxobacter diazotrophicus]